MLLRVRLSPRQDGLATMGSHHALSSLQLVDGALSELSGLLALAGLPVTLTPQYARPVAGYTLEVGPFGLQFCAPHPCHDMLVVNAPKADLQTLIIRANYTSGSHYHSGCCYV